MGDRRFLAVLLVAISVAIAAGFGVFRYLQNAEINARVPTRSVVVAAVDITEGQVITSDQAKVVSLPVASVPSDAFSLVDSVVGRVARIAVFTGEALVPGRLAPVGAGAGLEVKITPGKRAMAVKIDEVAGMSGLIQPNGRVDVLLTLKDEGSNEQQHAKLFMSNMRVLAVGSQIERGPDGRPMNATTAALEVTPEEAEELALAASQGKIQLVLRGYGDPDTVGTKGTSSREMMRRLDMTVPPAPTPAPTAAPRRPAPRSSSPRSAAPALAPMTAPAAKSPDSSVVQVYRRSTLTQQKIEKRDATKRDSVKRDSTPSFSPFE